MKPAAVRTKRRSVGVRALALLMLSGCTSTSIRLDPSTPFVLPSPARPCVFDDLQELGALRVAVVEDPDSDWPGAASEFAADMRRTGLFKEILAAPSPRPDLIASVRAAGGAGRCGLPAFWSLMTLGLLPGRTGYLHQYDVEFRDPRSNQACRFQIRYSGESLSGALAFFVRPSRAWAKPHPNGAPRVVVDRLKEDLSVALGRASVQ